MSQWGRVLMAAWLASTPLLVHGVSGNFAYLRDRDSGGGALYGGAPQIVTDAASCQAACTADPICYGWTVNRPSADSEFAFCYLKGLKTCDIKALTQVQPPGIYTSGVVGDSCTITCVGIDSDETVTMEPSNCRVITVQPTSTMAARRYRRDMAQRKAIALKKRLCPEGSSACPINARTIGYECVDLNEELESCGVCGNNCLNTPGVKDVTCSQGRCIVNSCAPGFALDPIAGECKAGHLLARRHPRQLC